MVISYRNRFLKVFLSSMLLFALIVILLTYIYNKVAKSTSEPIPDYMMLIFKYLLPVIVVLAYGLYAWSHYLLAKAKGYSGWLIGLAAINTIGLAIIFLLPDKSKNQIEIPAPLVNSPSRSNPN